MKRVLRTRRFSVLAAMLTACMIIAASAGLVIRTFSPLRNAHASGITIDEFNSDRGGVEIVAGSDGKLWFSDGGGFVETMTTSGVMAGDYGALSGGMTAGPDGNLWFTPTYTVDNFIGRITLNGIVSEYNVPTSNSDPFGITSGPDGNIWFTERYAHKIGKLTPGGVFTEYPIPSNGQPSSITSGPDGNLWFTETDGSYGIGKITTSGVFTEYGGGTSGSYHGITTGPDGRLWFTVGNGYVGSITTSGTETYYPAVGVLSPSWDITSGSDGNLWFTTYGTSIISRMTTSGTLTEYTVPSHNPAYGITSGPDGNVWFTENLPPNTITPIGRINLSAIPPLPNPPQNATAAPGDHAVTISWQAPVDNGAHIVQYRVVNVFSNAYATVSGNVFTYQVTGLPNCEATQWEVEAVDDQGNVSPPSNTAGPAWTHSTPHSSPATVVILAAGINSFVSPGIYSPIADVSTYCSQTSTATVFPQPLADSLQYFWGPSGTPTFSSPGYGSRLTDTLAGSDAVILPYSYAGAWFPAKLQSDPSKPQLAVLGYTATTVATQSLHADAQLMDNEVSSIHAMWPQARIFIIGHSNGGLVAEQWWLDYRKNNAANVTLEGVAHLWALDSPLNGVQNAPLCLPAATGAVCDVEIGVDGQLAHDWTKLWANQGTLDPMYLASDAQDHGIFTPVGTLNDPVFDFGDQKLPKLPEVSANGLISQLYFNEPACAQAGLDINTPACAPQGTSVVSSCVPQARSGPLFGLLGSDYDHARVLNCPGVITSIANVVAGP